MDEQHRLFTVLHLLQGGCFLKAIARFGSCRGAGGIQNWELRQAEPQFQLTGKNIPHAGVAAVLHKHFYLFRGVLPCCHHGGGGTHGNAVQHNFSFAVLRQHPVDPLQHILAVQPAHADIIALTVAAGAQIRGQHLVACIVVVLGQVGHTGMAAAVAVPTRATNIHLKRCLPIPPVKWIIPGLLPAGLAIFAGPSKAGKSWLTLWLCLQISQGKSVWGREIEPRTVLYFSLEDTLGRLQERLYQLVDAEEDPERLILQTESHGIGQGLEEQIVSFIHTYPDISLIVIDTLQKVRKGDQNGSMYANDYKDIGALKELADKYGICILLVHHLRKQSSSDPYDQISGSTGIMGVADTTWLMHRQRMGKTATIRVIGRDMDEKMLHIREENCIWTMDEEETAEQQALKAIPDYLWKVADYIDSVGKWQGTATELLVAANFRIFQSLCT